MNLDVYLIQQNPLNIVSHSGIFVRENGRTLEISRAEWDARFPGRDPITARIVDDYTVYHANITHNLNRMANEANLYEALWSPETYSISFASDLIGMLQAGLKELESNPEHYKLFNPKNGWGTYEGLVEFVRNYLAACEQYPDAVVSVSK